MPSSGCLWGRNGIICLKRLALYLSWSEHPSEMGVISVPKRKRQNYKAQRTGEVGHWGDLVSSVFEEHYSFAGSSPLQL